MNMRAWYTCINYKTNVCNLATARLLAVLLFSKYLLLYDCFQLLITWHIFNFGSEVLHADCLRSNVFCFSGNGCAVSNNRINKKHILHLWKRNNLVNFSLEAYSPHLFSYLTGIWFLLLNFPVLLIYTSKTFLVSPSLPTLNWCNEEAPKEMHGSPVRAGSEVVKQDWGHMSSTKRKSTIRRSYFISEGIFILGCEEKNL